MTLYSITSSARASNVGGISRLSALARVRGFALKNRDFAIFWWAKPLFYKGLHRQFPVKTAVVKTYPIPQRALMRLDSL
jgi:hypothetical protein